MPTHAHMAERSSLSRTAEMWKESYARAPVANACKYAVIRNEACETMTAPVIMASQLLDSSIFGGETALPIADSRRRMAGRCLMTFLMTQEIHLLQ